MWHDALAGFIRQISERSQVGSPLMGFVQVENNLLSGSSGLIPLDSGGESGG